MAKLTFNNYTYFQNCFVEESEYDVNIGKDTDEFIIENDGSLWKKTASNFVKQKFNATFHMWNDNAKWQVDFADGHIFSLQKIKYEV